MADDFDSGFDTIDTGSDLSSDFSSDSFDSSADSSSDTSWESADTIEEDIWDTSDDVAEISDTASDFSADFSGSDYDGGETDSFDDFIPEDTDGDEWADSSEMPEDSVESITNEDAEGGDDTGSALSNDIIEEDIADDPKVLERDEYDLLQTGYRNVQDILDVKADDYRDQGLSEEEIQERLSADRWQLQEEFLQDAFPGQEVSPHVFNGFDENGAADRIAEMEQSENLRDMMTEAETEEVLQDEVDLWDEIPEDTEPITDTGSETDEPEPIVDDTIEEDVEAVESLQEMDEDGSDLDAQKSLDADFAAEQESELEPEQEVSGDLFDEQEIPDETVPETEELTDEYATAEDQSPTMSERLNDPELFDKNIPGDYTYEESEHGKHASGQLTMEEGDRNSYAQRTVGGDDREAYDDGGHLIGTRFNGSGEYENLDAQNRDVNRGDYKRTENEWARSLSDNEKVFVDVQTHKSNGSDRPDAYMGYSITEKADGSRTWDAFSYQNASHAEQEDWSRTVEEMDPLENDVRFFDQGLSPEQIAERQMILEEVEAQENAQKLDGKQIR